MEHLEENEPEEDLIGSIWKAKERISLSFAQNPEAAWRRLRDIEREVRELHPDGRIGIDEWLNRSRARKGWAPIEWSAPDPADLVEEEDPILEEIWAIRAQLAREEEQDPEGFRARRQAIADCFPEGIVTQEGIEKLLELRKGFPAVLSV